MATAIVGWLYELIEEWRIAANGRPMTLS